MAVMRGLVCRHLPKATGFYRQSSRSMGSQYPVDDDLYGLDDDEKQLRRTMVDFCQKEIAPIAQQVRLANIDTVLHIKSSDFLQF